MAQIHDSMMNPRIEELLSKVDSKFTPGDAGRAAGPADQLLLRPARRGPRLHRAAAGHLGGPQAAVDRLRGDRRRQDRAVRDRARRARRRAGRRRGRATPPVSRPTSRTDRHERSPGAASSSASPAASPPTRRSRSAVAWSTPAPTSRPVMTEGATALRRARPPSRRWPPSRCRPRCGTRQPHPAHPARPGRRRHRGAPGHGPAAGRPTPPGCSDDLLTATLLATRAPVVVCPAMHTEMWEHPAVQENLATLRSPGRARGAARARAASPAATSAPAAWPTRPTSWPRSSGPRRRRRATSTACRVLVTAGGTREAIDPVRVITNRSSGKQGHAIAAEAARPRGAQVTLVTTARRPAPAGVEVVEVVSAAEHAGRGACPIAADADVIVMAAAVADFRPVRRRRPQAQEGRRRRPPSIVLEPTHDILVDLGRAKPPGQVAGGLRRRDRRRRRQRPRRSSSARTSTSSWPTTSAPRRRLRARHQRRRASSRRRRRWHQDVPLTDKRSVAERVLDAVVALAPPTLLPTDHERAAPSPDRPAPADKEHA